MALSQSLLSVFVLVVVLATATASASRPTIRMFSGKGNDMNPKCESWKFSMESNNLRRPTVPKECVDFVKKYFIDYGFSNRYDADLDYTRATALEFAQTVKPKHDGKDVWIFGVDDTLLSTLDYYAARDFGSNDFNETEYNAWVEAGAAWSVRHGGSLFSDLKYIGFKIIILTGRDETARKPTETNLKNEGISDWHKLIMRGAEDQGKDAIVYKKEKIDELVKEGYRLHGNVGDQWSDLLPSPSTTRTFKFPNPLYYVP